MAKPSTKAELISSAIEQFEKLFKMIDSFSEAQQNAEFSFDADKMASEAHWKRDKNLRDVLTHLYEWHRLALEWEQANSQGLNKPFLPAPYTWKTYGEMNVEFWKNHQNTSLEQAKQLLNNSHSQMLAMIEKYSDEQLFTKQFFAWTGTSSLGQYCISATSSHYAWAIKKLKCLQKAK